MEMKSGVSQKIVPIVKVMRQEKGSILVEACDAMLE